MPSEFFGRANFEHPTQPSLADLNPHFEDLDQHYVSSQAPAPKGEMIVELHERVNKALNRLITELDDDPRQPRTVLICTHAATMIAIGRVLTGRMPDDPDEDDFQCYTASLSKFVRRDMESGKGVIGNWDCALNSETSYLSGGAERGW
jgi:transcription factor C subunit 7